MKKVFIDGSAGTTGLRIYERLSQRKDISLIKLTEENRKDSSARKEAINNSDITFLCLPDAAAIEAVTLIENNCTAIIDTSTAHRVNDQWTYGFAELCGMREKIKQSKRIANPGCHASGFISLIAPLVEYGLIDTKEKLSCFSLTGYSGGGKNMINQYENEPTVDLKAPGMYALTQNHKHLPEMKKICNLQNEPVFCPIVAPYYSGMQVTVPLFNVNKSSVCDAFQAYYKSEVVKFNSDYCSTLYASSFSGRDDMEICVCGNDERLTLISRFDNLGKGASGAAIQNMNIILGVDECEGLVIGD